MSATRLLILGVVRILQPVHGYDVRRELLRWNADEWANVAPGSIYHALKKLADEGMLHSIGPEQLGARPARTRYELTERGEEEFQDLLRDYWWRYRQPIDPFSVAFAFLPALPRDEAEAALGSRAVQLRAVADAMKAGVNGRWKSQAPHVEEILLLAADRMRVEADWCDRVAARVAAGGLPTTKAAGT